MHKKSLVKKFISFLFIIFFIIISPLSVKAEADNFSSESIALQFYLEHIGTTDSSYQNNLTIGHIITFFNMENHISATMYSFVDSNNQPHGYVVIDENNALIPIIEFAFDGESFITAFENQLAADTKTTDTNITYYYLGGYQYIAKLESEEISYYNLLNGQQLDSIENISYIAPTLELPVSSRSTQATEVTVPGYNQSYYATSYFGGSKNCGPTAGVNLCVYYYNNGKSNIRYNSWDQTYNLIYEAMKTNTLNGTYSRFIQSGMEEYVTSRGYSCATALDVNNPTGVATFEIDNGRPLLLALYRDSTYGDHVVMAVGYKTENGTTYFRIADGWGSTANRYIYDNAGTISECITLLFR